MMIGIMVTQEDNIAEFETDIDFLFTLHDVLSCCYLLPPMLFCLSLDL